MDSLPLVSVVVPVYNRAKIVTRTLDSILNQTYQNLEVIIVDDGSIDETASVIKKYIQSFGNEKIKYIFQDNAGVSNARNRGLHECSGELVCFFDSDDIMLSKRIETQVERMKEMNSDLCLAGIHYANRNIDVIPKLISNGQFLKSFMLNLDNVFMGTQGWLFKRNVLLEIGGYDNELCIYEDCDLVFRYLIHLKSINVAIVSEVLTLYSDDVRDDRLTNLKNSRDKEFHKGYITFYARLISYSISKNEVLSVRKNFIQLLKFYAKYFSHLSNSLKKEIGQVKNSVYSYNKLLYVKGSLYYNMLWIIYRVRR